MRLKIPVNEPNSNWRIDNGFGSQDSDINKQVDSYVET